MQTKVIALALLLIASSLAGCTSGDPQTVEHDSRIAELEASQQELTIAPSGTGTNKLRFNSLYFADRIRKYAGDSGP